MIRRWLRRGLAAALPAMAILLWAINDPWHSWSSWTATANDSRFLWQNHQPSDQVIFLDIDQSTERTFGRWPWNRSDLADALRDLPENAVIVLDMVFPAKTNPANDKALAEVLLQHPLTVCGLSLRTNASGHEADSMPAVLPSTLPGKAASPDAPAFSAFPFLEYSHALFNDLPPHLPAPFQGAMNVLPDADGHIRSYPLALYFVFQSSDDSVTPHPLPSLGMQALRLFTHARQPTLPGASSDPLAHIHDFSLFPHDSQGKVRLNFYAHGSYPRLSFMDWVNGEIEPAFLQNKIIVIGLSEAGVADIVDTPVGRLPGPLVHSTFLHNALKGHFLQTPPTWLDYAALLAVLLVLLVSPIPSFPLRLLLYAGLSAAAYSIHLSLFSNWLFDTDIAAQLAILLAAVAGTEGALFHDSQRRLRRLDRSILAPQQTTHQTPPKAHSLPDKPFPAAVLRLQWFTQNQQNNLSRQILPSLTRFQSEIYEQIASAKGTIIEVNPTGCTALFGLDHAPSWKALRDLLLALYQSASPPPPINALSPDYHPLLPVGSLAYGDIITGWTGMESWRQVGILGPPADATTELITIARLFGQATFLLDASTQTFFTKTNACLRPIPIPGQAQLLPHLQPPILQILPDQQASHLLAEQFAQAYRLFQNGDPGEGHAIIRNCAELYLDPLAARWLQLFSNNCP